MAPQSDLSIHLVRHGKRTQAKWLHKIKKTDTPDCRCQDHQEQTGRHLAEECRLLTEARGLVEKEEIREWATRHTRDKKKKKGDVGKEKEEEKEEGERLANFFYAIYDFLVPIAVPNAFVPAELPARYVFLRLSSSLLLLVPTLLLFSPVNVSLTDYSVVCCSITCYCFVYFIYLY